MRVFSKPRQSEVDANIKGCVCALFSYVLKGALAVGRGIAVHVAERCFNPKAFIDVVHSDDGTQEKMRETRIALVAEPTPSYAAALACTSESIFKPQRIT